MKDPGTLVARVLMPIVFIVAGWNKLGTGYDNTLQYMASMGVPGALLPLVIAVEIGGGLAVLTGTLTRLAAAGLAIFCLASAPLFHSDFAASGQSVQFMKNLAMAGGFLLLCLHGAGAFSVDAWWSARRR